MPVLPRSLKGTRHTVWSRLAIVIVLGVMVFSFAALSYGSSADANSSTSTTSSGSTTSTSSGSTTTTSTTTTSTTYIQAAIYKVNNATLADLVSSTTARFSNSTNGVPYYVVSENNSVTGLVYLTTDVALGESYGYHGPVGILAYVSPTGTIKALRLWISNEPMTYSITPQYLASYTNHSVFDNMKVGSDVVGITGATYTSVAIASGVRDGGRIVVNDYSAAESHNSTSTTTQSTSTVETSSSTSVTNITTTNETSAPLVDVISSKQFTTAGVVSVFFVAAVVAYEVNSDKMRYVILGAAVVVLGFYEGVMVSITDAHSFISLVFPPLRQYFWYVLYAAVILTSLVWGRLYCGSICPFGSFTHLLYKVSPFHLAMPKRVTRWLAFLKYGVLAVAVVALAGGALWVAGVEPFMTFFFLRGADWTWGVLGLALVLSIPFDRFYCRYVCPAGAGLAVAARLRIREINRWPECRTCKVCERGCPTGAISDGKISASECMNCRTCEVNYSNKMICPHYSLWRASGGASPIGTGRSGPSSLVFSDENRTPS